MVAGKTDLVIEQEDTFLRILTWTESDEVTPINLTGYTAKMTINYISNGIGGAHTISTTWSTGGWIRIDGSLGKITLLIPASITEDFTWRNGAYDLHLTATDQTVYRLIEGAAIVNPSQTDAV